MNSLQEIENDSAERRDLVGGRNAQAVEAP
jgi:hypothetical protein